MLKLKKRKINKSQNYSTQENNNLKSDNYVYDNNMDPKSFHVKLWQ